MSDDPTLQARPPLSTPAAFAAEPAVPHPPSVMPFRFTGTAGEYFRIWIVNALLSVLTLGIYSAWAKVRTKQYFYRHTFLGDASFEYLANPVAILKGRILVFTVLLAVSFAQQLSIILYAVLALGLVLATPWVIVQALRFAARNTAYRNVRLSFQGTVEDAYLAYLVGGAAYLFSCGLCAPYLQWRVSQFAVEGHRFGDQSLRFRTSVGDYFVAFLLAVAMTLPIVGLYMGGMFTMIAVQKDAPDPAAMSNFMMGTVIIFYALLILPGAWFKARMANLFWGGIDVGEHTVESTQTFKEVLVLQVTNVLGVIFSLGLAIPWAVVRSYRYRIEHLTLHTNGPLVVTAQPNQGKPNAFGDAATDLGDFGLDLG